MSIKGKRILVTGAANGCGEGVVRHLVAEGASVVATDIDDARGEALVAELDAGNRLSYARCNVADREQVFTVIAQAAAHMGGLDGLVNPAGIVHQTRAEAAMPKDIDRVFDIHVKGTINTNQAAYELMKKAGGGAIVNFVSIAGIRGMRGFPIYGAAKGAVLAWTHNVALEWGADNIRVNAIAPAMETAMTRLSRSTLDEEGLARLNAATRSVTPLRGTLGDPERDLAPLIALLVSDGGSYITGQAIAVDGGMMMLGS